jgi:uncharacterized protein (DUF4415 family)
MKSFAEQLYGAFQRMEAKKKRGRPALLGRKVVCSVRLTPDVAKFCRQHPDGFPVLESTLRASKAFKAWMKNNASEIPH